MARTTVRLDERLLARAKTYAAEHGRTFNSVMEDALRELLTRHHRETATSDESTELPTFRGDGLMPGIDPSPRGVKDAMYAEEDEQYRWMLRDAAE